MILRGFYCTSRSELRHHTVKEGSEQYWMTSSEGAPGCGIRSLFPSISASRLFLTRLEKTFRSCW